MLMKMPSPEIVKYANSGYSPDTNWKRARDKGEVNLLQPIADGAVHRRDQGCHQQRADKGDRDRDAGALHDQTETVGAEAEEHAVPERNHAGVTDQQIE